MHFNLKMILVAALIAMQVDSSSGATDPVFMVEAVVESSKTLGEMIVKFKDLVLGPVIEAMDEKIQKINTNIEGITEEEKELVTDSLENQPMSYTVLDFIFDKNVIIFRL